MLHIRFDSHSMHAPTVNCNEDPTHNMRSAFYKYLYLYINIYINIYKYIYININIYIYIYIHSMHLAFPFQCSYKQFNAFQNVYLKLMPRQNKINARLWSLWLKQYDLDNGVISMTVYPSRYFLNGRTNEGSLSALPDNKKLSILRSIIVSITEALTGVIYFIPLLSNWAFPLNPSICFLYSCLVDASETIFSRSQLTKIEHILKSGVWWIR